MKTITVEILRRGPAHGQLLSPLTEYLALCGNRDAETLRVPFEHRQLLTALNALYYRDSKVTQQLQLEDAASALGRMLGELRGLVAELSDGSDRKADSGDRKADSANTKDMVHLRLILTASELALLPLELARSAPGMPGSGQHLALQNEVPLSITREIRRVTDQRLQWPGRPKILFLASAVAGKIPMEAHTLALRRLIEPWMWYDFSCNPPKAKVGEHLTILPAADAKQVSEAIAKERYTHIHVLAHGASFSYAGDERYGIALHDAKDPGKPDIVDGSRLAALLKPSSPAVVTLATCQSGAGGSVVGPGASVAHALHQSGVPLVVASQFPLTFTASIVMVEEMYAGLLRGQDPRRILHQLRDKLKARMPGSHDWASLVAYASLPESLERQLFGVQLGRLRQQVNAAMDQMDKSIESSTASGFDRLNDVRERLKAIDTADKWQKEELNGLLASLEKREAQVRMKLGKRAKKSIEPILRRSRNYYWEAYKANHASTWALTQYLVLEALLSKGRFREDQWATAHFLSERDHSSGDPETRIWALGSLIELHLIALLHEPSPLIPSHGKIREHARRFAREMNESSVVREIYTTRMQIIRYRDMFHDWFKNDEMRRLAIELIPILSKGITFGE
ncbi:MAG: CHAT domain-containing protein [Bryobacteraceae bacterium]